MKKPVLFAYALLAGLFAACNQKPAAPQPAANTATQPATTTTQPATNTTTQPTATSDQAAVEKLAAFYQIESLTGVGNDVVLTLNADPQRSFSMMYAPANAKSKTVDPVEITGTWTVQGDIVTLNGKVAFTKFQALEDGLIPIKEDGTKLEKEKLARVMGE